MQPNRSIALLLGHPILELHVDRNEYRFGGVLNAAESIRESLFTEMEFWWVTSPNLDKFCRDALDSNNNTLASKYEAWVKFIAFGSSLQDVKIFNDFAIPIRVWNNNQVIGTMNSLIHQIQTQASNDKLEYPSPLNLGLIYIEHHFKNSEQIQFVLTQILHNQSLRNVPIFIDSRFPKEFLEDVYLPILKNNSDHVYWKTNEKEYDAVKENSVFFEESEKNFVHLRTLGGNGAAYFHNGVQTSHITKYEYRKEPVQPIGCGDSFMGTFAAHIINRYPVDVAVRLGMAAGHVAAMHEGIYVPSSQEILLEWKKHNKRYMTTSWREA